MGTGKVYIIGAGPGAGDLLTLRGRKALCQADVILCDYLLPQSFLDEAGLPIAEKTIEWLPPGKAGKDQDRINQLMRDTALQGKIVARLKNGDPFVFGRGNEEVDYLARHGIAVEIIPGLSACTAVLTAAGLPLTNRQVGRSFAVVTARCAGGGVNDDYPHADSLVIFMGVSVLDNLVSQLLRHGWPTETPAAILERVTLPWERRVAAQLAKIATVARAKDMASPAVLVVGAAASRDRNFQSRPRILFTGLDPSNFRTLGDLLHWPALQVEPEPAGVKALPEILQRLKLGEFHYAVFTSKLGVRAFFTSLEEHHLDTRILSGLKIVTAGAGTAMKLQEYGLRPDTVAQEPGSEGILKTIGELHGKAVLLVQGTHAPQGLELALRERGATLTRLALHRVVPHPELGRPLPDHDVIYFVSPSGVRAYWDTYGEAAFQSEAWCIGEVTLAALDKLGIKGKVVDPHASAHENA